MSTGIRLSLDKQEQQFFDYCYSRFMVKEAESNAIYTRGPIALTAAVAVGASFAALVDFELFQFVRTDTLIATYFLFALFGYTSLAVALACVTAAMIPRNYPHPGFVGFVGRLRNMRKQPEEAKTIDAQHPRTGAITDMLFDEILERLCQADEQLQKVQQARSRWLTIGSMSLAASLLFLGLTFVFSVLIEVLP